MKHLYILLSIIIFTYACSPGGNTITLVENHQSEYSILVSPAADSLTNEAAKEIQHFVAEISGFKLPITTEPTEKPQIIIGSTMANVNSPLTIENEDGFLIDFQNGNILLQGNNDKGNMYAAYTFIEEYLGCQMLATDEFFIPKNEAITVSTNSNTYAPSFDFRMLNLPGAFNPRFAHWHKLERLQEWGNFVHTFHDLISPEEYYAEHPEYFSLVGEKRLGDGQLCLSNPEVIRVLKENLAKEIAKNPSKKYWSVSQNDCFNYCECEHCTALYEKYGNISGAYIQMANEIAEAFPDKQISTLAYNFTRSAPQNIQPLDNVNIMFCSIECNRSMPLEADPRSQDFVADMKNWSSLTNNIFLWDYVVQFKNFLCPFPNMKVLQPNLQFFHDNHVNMVFEQGSGHDWSDLAELKQFLLVKLMWDKDANVPALVDEFLTKYYGSAAPYIKEYYELAHQNLAVFEETERLDIYGFPADYFDSYLSAARLKDYKRIMDEAEIAAKDDIIFLNRVLRARLAVDFAYLDIALNKNTDGLSYFEATEEKIIAPEMVEYLARFTENSIKTNAPNINERLLKTTEYQQFVLRKLDMMTRPNLAKDKKVEIKTTYSPNYPVGGAGALTDGIIGELDYHHNWLGFEGNDMIVEIDLLEKESVSSVTMNFLKAINSWTFLPTSVEIELSPDGKKYHKVGTIITKDEDRGFLVKSVPYVINFETEEAQYIRVTANSIKECPIWHRGYGKPSWIFIDEMIVE